MSGLGREPERSARKPWFLAAGWMIGLSLIAWIMANVLDVVSVLAMIQAGDRVAWAPCHAAEALLIYGQVRLLLTLAVPLGIASAIRRWPWLVKSAWGALSLCALVTAAAAWWRLYQ